MKIIPFALLAVLLPSPSQADPLQFTLGPRAAFAAYATVRVVDANNSEKFSGVADRLGRIAVTLPPGTYRAIVTSRGTSFSSDIQIIGAGSLKTIALK